jgi:hypothetical protein
MKVVKILDNITNSATPGAIDFYNKKLFSNSSTKLSQLESANDDELRNLIMTSPSATCNLDPIPSKLFKENSPCLIPHVKQLINSSLEEGNFPVPFKKAIVTTLLKKDELEKKILKIIYLFPISLLLARF